MSRKLITRVILVVVAALIVAGGIAIADAQTPPHIDPDPEWESYADSLDAQRERFFVDADDGTRIEAELFIPSGGSDPKAAVVWTSGSSGTPFQNYSWDLIKTYVLEPFLAHDIAVLLTNKRGVGASEGNWYLNGIEGRAADVYAAVRTLQAHPDIDSERVGVIGHSQGGWVVQLIAAEHDDVAFFVSLAGPTTSVTRNAEDNYYHLYRCEGYEGAELDQRIARHLRLTNTGLVIGSATHFAPLYHDALLFSYDPADTLRAVRQPGLLIYAEHDAAVTPSVNLERLDDLFDGDPPANLTTVVLERSTHYFRLVDDPCESYVDPEQQPPSEELVAVLDDWLAAQGY